MLLAVTLLALVGGAVLCNQPVRGSCVGDADADASEGFGGLCIHPVLGSFEAYRPVRAMLCRLCSSGEEQNCRGIQDEDENARTVPLLDVATTRPKR